MSSIKPSNKELHHALVLYHKSDVFPSSGTLGFCNLSEVEQMAGHVILSAQRLWVILADISLRRHSEDSNLWLLGSSAGYFYPQSYTSTSFMICVMFLKQHINVHNSLQTLHPYQLMFERKEWFTWR